MKATKTRLWYAVVGPIIRVQMHEFVLLATHNSRTNALSDCTIVPLPLRLDGDAVVAPIRVELDPAHFIGRSERNHEAHCVLLQHAEKILAR